MSAQSTRGPVYRPITAVVLPAHWRDCLMNASFALAEREKKDRWRAGAGPAETGEKSHFGFVASGCVLGTPERLVCECLPLGQRRVQMKLALAQWPSQKIAFGQFGLAGIFCYASAKPSELLAVGVFVLRAGPVRPKRGKN